MTATITRPQPRKSAAKDKPQSPYKRLHVIIPIEDMLWASQQKPSVNQLWQECWTSDPYGSRWMPLSTALGYSSFICAKKILLESGLFIFKPDKSIQDGRETVGWMVQNLHGSRMKDFWEKPNAENSDMNAAPEEMRCKYTASISDESQTEQGLQKLSRTVQQHLTNSSVEFVRCVSSTQDKFSREAQTADAPFGGASPQIVEGVEEEKEELPAVTNCTTLTLVDDVLSQPASLVKKKQELGDESGANHEDMVSAPVASNCENLNQLQDQAQPSQSASLMEKNQELGDEPEISHEDTFSAVPTLPAQTSPSTSSSQEPKAHSKGVCAVAADSNPEKWSYEAVVERSRVRPWRMEKLKMAEQWRENPGDDFLMECWADDPALRIVIKKLVIKCPHWGFVAADGVLVKWEDNDYFINNWEATGLQ